MYYRIRWMALIEGLQGIGYSALPRELVERICAELNTCGIPHWVEVHEYHARVGPVPAIFQEHEKPSVGWRWN